MRQIKNPPHKKWASQESTFGCIKVLQIEYGIIFVIASTATGTLGRTSSSLTSAWQSWLRWFWYCCSDGKYSLNSAHIMSAKFGRSRDAYACTNLRDFFLREICWEVGVICVNLLCKFCVYICCANFLGRYVLRGVICANSAAAVSQLPEMQPLKNLQARASLFSSLHLSPTAFALLISNTKLDNTNNAIWDGSSQSLQLTWV